MAIDVDKKQRKDSESVVRNLADPEVRKELGENWHESWTNRLPPESHATLHRNKKTREWRFTDVKINDDMVTIPQSSIPREIADEHIAFYTPCSVGIWWIVNANNKDSSVYGFIFSTAEYEHISDPDHHGVLADGGMRVYCDEPTLNKLAAWTGLGVPVAFDLGGGSVWVLIGSHTDELDQKKKKKVYLYSYQKTDMINAIQYGDIPVSMEEALAAELKRSQKLARQRDANAALRNVPG